MFADRVLAWAADKKSRGVSDLDAGARVGMQAAALDVLAVGLPGARFRMDDRAAKMVWAAATKPDALEASRAYLRWPAPSCWVEWPGGENADIGVLFVSEDGADLQRGMVLLVVTTPETGKRLFCTYGRCDLTNPKGPIIWPNAEKSLADMHAFWRPDLDVTPNEEAIQAIRKLRAITNRVACGFMALLNSPKTVRIEEADFTQLNKRRKQMKRPPLLSHRVVTIDLGKVERTLREGDAAEDGPGTPRQQHFVRWHLRLVRGVLYPVRPHWRGDPSLGTKAPPSYQLTAREQAHTTSTSMP